MNGKLIVGGPRKSDGLPMAAQWLLIESEAPQGFIDNWHWVVAVDAYDTGDPKPIAELLSDGCEIPENVRVVLANIVKGKRKPSPKARRKIKGKDRLQAGLSWLRSEAWRKLFLDNAVLLADRDGDEPIDVVRFVDSSYDDQEAMLFEKYGIGKSTLDNTRKLLKAKIKKWPTL